MGTKLLSVAMVLVGLMVGAASANDEQRYTKLCRRESTVKRNFETMPLDDARKGKTWTNYVRAREARMELGKSLYKIDCRDVTENMNQIVVLDDEQLFRQLCVDERLLELDTKDPSWSSIRTGIKQLYYAAKDRRTRFGFSIQVNRCPDTADAEATEAVANRGDIMKKMKQQLDQSCVREVYYSYLRSLVQSLVLKSKTGQLSKVYRDASENHSSAYHARTDLCQGNVVDCCGDLAANARQRSSLDGAKEISKNLLGVVHYNEGNVDAFRKNFNLDETFRKLCELEQKTGAGSQHYKARASSLKALHKQIHHYRTLLGEAINQETCPLVSTSVETKGAQVNEIKIEPRCEEEVKTQLMCEALENARPQVAQRYLGPYLDEVKGWCDRKKKAQEDKVSPTKNYRPAQCTDQMRSVLAEEVAVEAPIVVAMSQMKRDVEDMNNYQHKLAAIKRDIYETMQLVEKAFKTEYNEQVDAQRKEFSRQAYEHIKSKRMELEASGGFNKPNKFSLLKPSTW